MNPTHVSESKEMEPSFLKGREMDLLNTYLQEWIHRDDIMWARDCFKFCVNLQLGVE